MFGASILRSHLNIQFNGSLQVSSLFLVICGRLQVAVAVRKTKTNTVAFEEIH